MCMGVPMRVVEMGEGYAWCEGRSGRQRIDTMLVGDQRVGTWLLTFLGGAREVISAQEAQRIGDALDAVSLVMQGGGDIDHLFADLVDREPPRPATARQIKNEVIEGGE